MSKAGPKAATARKTWGGRFAAPTAKAVERFTQSLSYDLRLLPYDVRGSIAHARMLARQGIIAPEEGEALVLGLEKVLADWRSGKLSPRPELEDVHTLVEARLRETIGEVADKLHTARSRNDQVALDLRLYLKEVLAETARGLRSLQRALLAQAEAHLGTVMPGYTHLQRAQPVLLAHHLMAYFHMLQRDLGRFGDCLRRTDQMPLGSGALAGVPYPIDRGYLARELSFARISENSLDAVSDRDFAVEFLAACTIAMLHLSRLAEEIVLWSSAEFGFVELDDAYATGSSIMPQKKNPDVAELVRAKAGRVLGDLTALCAVLKGLPLAYNRDLQEDKEPLFDAADTLLSSLEVMAGLVSSLRFRGEAMAAALERGHILATEFADYLARKGVPFRQAHVIVGRLVRYCEEKGLGLTGLPLEEYKRFSEHFGPDIAALSVESALAARAHYGGTAPAQVREAIATARELVQRPWPEQGWGEETL